MEIHYFAAARAARGTGQETVADVPDTLADLLDQLSAEHTGTTDAGMNLGEVFERCSFLVDGARAGQGQRLAGVQRVDVLPPFAGG
ncbi:MoaD/ThiS family protein [Corynebacterium halotolerans]|uniref:MoaD/ThiS family protein n=1 Tax=Corynebacterium halotolerans TaxID=225326 RepID=UPI003CEFC440